MYDWRHFPHNKILCNFTCSFLYAWMKMDFVCMCYECVYMFERARDREYVCNEIDTWTSAEHFETSKCELWYCVKVTDPGLLTFMLNCVRENEWQKKKKKRKKRVGWEVINRFYFCLTFSAYHKTTTSVLSKTETKEKQFLKSSADLGVVFLSWEKIWRSFSWHICVFVCAYINIHACFLCVRAYVRVHAHVLVYMCGCDHVWT